VTSREKKMRACTVLTQTVSNSEDLISLTPTLKPRCHWYIAVAVHVRTHTSSAAAIYTQNHKDNVHWTSAPIQPSNTPRCNLQRRCEVIPMYCNTHLTKSKVLKILAFWRVWPCRQTVVPDVSKDHSGLISLSGFQNDRTEHPRRF
jgi:hypothetical protein